jgi:hypothetical protein
VSPLTAAEARQRIPPIERSPHPASACASGGNLPRCFLLGKYPIFDNARPDETHRLLLKGRNFTVIEVVEMQTFLWIVVAVIVVAVIAYNTVDDPFNIDPK